MEINEILDKTKNIAVVGLSKDRTKDSYRVSEYMKSSGYNIIPINPTTDQIMNIKSYDSLKNLPENIGKQVDIVNIFRKKEFVKEIVIEAIELKKKYNKLHTIWMQIGIDHEEAEEFAEKNGLKVITNKCLMIEHKRM